MKESGSHPSSARQRQFLQEARLMSGLPLELLDGPVRFEARAVYHGLGDVMIGEVRGAPQGVAYGGGSPTSETCLFNVPCRTHGHITFGNERESLVANRVYALGDAGPWNLVEERSFHHLVLRAPRAALPKLNGRMPERGAMRVGAASTTLVALMRSLVGVQGDLDHLSADSRAAIGTSLCSLLDAALGPATAVAMDAAIEPGAVLRAREQYHRQRIHEHVLEHLGDPTLDVESIARAVGLSPRHVHRLHVDEVQPLMRSVWSERLDRCRAELLAEDVHKPISAIAYAWGFTDSAHFSRAFRQRFGINPRALRERRSIAASD